MIYAEHTVPRSPKHTHSLLNLQGREKLEKTVASPGGVLSTPGTVVCEATDTLAQPVSQSVRLNPGPQVPPATGDPLAFSFGPRPHSSPTRDSLVTFSQGNTGRVWFTRKTFIPVARSTSKGGWPTALRTKCRRPPAFETGGCKETLSQQKLFAHLQYFVRRRAQCLQPPCLRENRTSEIQ